MRGRRIHLELKKNDENASRYQSEIERVVIGCAMRHFLSEFKWTRKRWTAPAEIADLCFRFHQPSHLLTFWTTWTLEFTLMQPRLAARACTLLGTLDFIQGKEDYVYSKRPMKNESINILVCAL